MSIVALIPSYKPDEMLLKTVRELRGAGFAHVYVVDDGSPAEHLPFFEQVRRESGCHVLRHGVNMGKGRALRTAFNQIMLDMPSCTGVVVCDADGQHEVSAVKHCAQLLIKHPDCLVLGARQFFKARVPAANLAGNTITRLVFFLLAGLPFGDTQCGLRGYPMSQIKRHFMETPGNRFEFENMTLLDLRRFRIDYVEYPMKAVYEEVKRVTHFNKLVDSIRIYSMLAGFAALPIFCAMLSSLLFALGSGTALWAFITLLIGWIPMALSAKKPWLGGLVGIAHSALGGLCLYALVGLTTLSPLASWWVMALPLAALGYWLWLRLRFGGPPRRKKYTSVS